MVNVNPTIRKRAEQFPVLIEGIKKGRDMLSSTIATMVTEDRKVIDKVFIDNVNELSLSKVNESLLDSANAILPDTHKINYKSSNVYVKLRSYLISRLLTVENERIQGHLKAHNFARGTNGDDPISKMYLNMYHNADYDKLVIPMRRMMKDIDRIKELHYKEVFKEIIIEYYSKQVAFEIYDEGTNEDLEFTFKLDFPVSDKLNVPFNVFVNNGIRSLDINSHLSKGIVLFYRSLDNIEDINSSYIRSRTLKETKGTILKQSLNTASEILYLVKEMNKEKM